MADRTTAEPAIRRRRARTPPGIPFATVERLVATLHGLDSRDPAALRARLHNLRRLNFPDGVAAGSGRHFAYAGPDVIGIAVAFELIEAFVPPVAAVAIVRAGWPEIARVATQGWSGADPSAVATVHPRSLRNPAGPDDALPPHHVEVLAIAGAPDTRRTIAIDIGRLSRRVSEFLRQSDPRSHSLMDAGMTEMDRRFGAGPSLDRGAGAAGRLGGDGPYWQRAGALLAAVGNEIAADDARALTWMLDYAVRPAPVDRWKTRVEVGEGVDVGFGAALAWVCARSGLKPARTPLQADRLEQVGSLLLGTFSTMDSVRCRLMDVAADADRSSRQIDV